jgi:hypothetical protein
MKVDGPKTKAALDRAGATEECPICHGRAWSGAPTTHKLEAMDESGALMMGVGIDVIPITCTSCGYVRLHAAQLLLAA